MAPLVRDCFPESQADPSTDVLAPSYLVGEKTGANEWPDDVGRETIGDDHGRELGLGKQCEGKELRRKLARLVAQRLTAQRRGGRDADRSGENVGDLNAGAACRGPELQPAQSSEPCG